MNKLLITIALIVTAPFGRADVYEALGTVKWGGLFAFNQMEIKDPDGETLNAFAWNPIYLVAHIPTDSKNVRYTISTGWQTYSHEATEEEIGQESARYFAQAGYRYRYPFTRDIKVWFESGLGVSVSEFASRHTIDQEGYLGQSYELRESTDPYIFVSSSYYWDVNIDWSMGIYAQYEHTLGENLNGLSFGINFLYE